MRIFGSCLMIAETAENPGDLTDVILAEARTPSYSGLKKRAPQAKATA